MFNVSENYNFPTFQRGSNIFQGQRFLRLFIGRISSTTLFVANALIVFLRLLPTIALFMNTGAPDGLVNAGGEGRSH